jgi:hypothetical protein
MSQEKRDPISNNFLSSESISDSQKLLFLQKYLENPFSITWSKLAQWILYRSERRIESDRTQESNLSINFMDRVDPSVYYTIFFPHQKF